MVESFIGSQIVAIRTYHLPCFKIGVVLPKVDTAVALPIQHIDDVPAPVRWPSLVRLRLGDEAVLVLVRNVKSPGGINI